MFMGWVDKNDQLRGYYFVRSKSRKSYKYLFWFLFDVAIVNSYILYAYSPAVGRKKNMKEFRLGLANQLLGSYNSRKYRGKPHTHYKKNVERCQYPITHIKPHLVDADSA